MSRYYRDLHDRELLSQAASIIQEVQERKLLDIFLPPDACMPDEDTAIFPRRLASIGINKERLALTVEPRFFQSAKRANAGN
jgi:hypothetical protein